MGALNGPLNRAVLEGLDREQLITLLLAAFEKIAEAEKKIAELEARLNQNSSNSSRPPSSDGYTKPKPQSQRKKSGKKPGGQHKHQGHGTSMADKATETKVVSPEVCPCCGESLGNVRGRRTGTHYVTEMPPITVTVTEYIREEKKCPACGRITRAEFPHEAAAPQQYGPNLKAFTVMLAETGMVAMGRAAQILEAVTGIAASCGTVANTIERCAENLSEPVKRIKEAVKGAKTGHFDETGMRSQGRLKWLHTASTRLLTYLEMHAKRGREAMDGIGVLNDFKGTAVHDCLSSYWNYPCAHALCNAHLLRELAFIDETTGQRWADGMAGLLLEAKEAVGTGRLRRKASLPKAELSKYTKRYDKLVEEGLNENPGQPRLAGRRGRVKQGKARLLLLRLRDHKEEYLRFASDFTVPFDNNQAERDFRMAKVKQKVSGCFRSEGGGKSFATIYSFIQTLKKNGVSVFDELVKAFKGDYSFPFQLVTE